MELGTVRHPACLVMLSCYRSQESNYRALKQLQSWAVPKEQRLLVFVFKNNFPGTVFPFQYLYSQKLKCGIDLDACSGRVSGENEVMCTAEVSSHHRVQSAVGSDMGGARQPCDMRSAGHQSPSSASSDSWTSTNGLCEQ